MIEISTDTIKPWLDKMNARVVDKLNSESTAKSKDWVAFGGQYDAVRGQVEATYDSGKGSLVRVCYFDFRVSDDALLARAAIEDVKHNSARILLSNTRRHGMVDCKDLAERDHVEEKKLYWYFREHAKEAGFRSTGPVTYGCDSSSWAKVLCEGIARVFDVGEKRQGKVGVSAAESVANAEFKQRIDNARNTIELLDDTTGKLQAMLAKCDGYFKPAQVTYKTNDARCYTNPYSKTLFAQIPCEARIYLNPEKLKYRCEGTRKNYALMVTYKLMYDEEFDSVTDGNITYSTGGYYFDEVEVDVGSTGQYVGTKLMNDLSESTAFPTTKVNLTDFETRVIGMATARLGRLSKLVEFAQK